MEVKLWFMNVYGRYKPWLFHRDSYMFCQITRGYSTLFHGVYPYISWKKPVVSSDP
jgi:hypothetical protein